MIAARSFYLFPFSDHPLSPILPLASYLLPLTSYLLPLASCLLPLASCPPRIIRSIQSPHLIDIALVSIDLAGDHVGHFDDLSARARFVDRLAHGFALEAL